MKQKKDKKDKSEKKNQRQRHPDAPGILIPTLPMDGSVVPSMQSTENGQLMAQAVYARGKIPSDVLGSYTGKPAAGDKPVQDADDL